MSIRGWRSPGRGTVKAEAKLSVFEKQKEGRVCGVSRLVVQWQDIKYLEVHGGIGGGGMTWNDLKSWPGAKTIYLGGEEQGCLWFQEDLDSTLAFIDY